MMDSMKQPIISSDERQKEPQQQPAPQPPAYYTTRPENCFQPTSFGSRMPLVQPGQPTIMITQPMVVPADQVPNTTCALIMTTLSAVLCSFTCGAVGILMAWKARLLVLDKKFEHARHTLRIGWVFFAIALFFGLALWSIVGFYMYYIIGWRYYLK